MIVQCEKCQSKFNLDQALIKEEGSRVRCSVCRNVFTIYPPQQEVAEDQALVQDLDEALEETVALDSPPAFDQEREEPFETGGEATPDFDQAFEEAIEEELPERSPERPFTSEEAVKEETPGLYESITEDLTGGDEKEKGERTRHDETIEPVSGEEKAPRSSRGLLIILMIVLLLILFSAAVYFFFPRYLPGFLSSQKPVPMEVMTDKGVKQLTFKEVSGSFVETESGKQRFIIRGKIFNHYPHPRSYVLVKAEILDEKGQAILTKLAYSGNVFTEKETKQMPMAEIDRIMKERTGRNNMNLNVKPDTAVPFVVVFENLPQSLSEFSVEAVSSSPGE